LPALTGVFRLQDPVYSWRAASSVGGPCKGLGQYDGILGGTPVVVKDATGAVIAPGAHDIGKVAGGLTREYEFEVSGAPNADGTHGSGADQDAAAAVLDELDEAFVADLVNPTARGRRDLRQARADVDALVAGLALGEADGGHLGVGEGDPGLGPIARAGCRF